MTPLSPHFSLEEMMASQVAARCGIDNTPTPDIVTALTETARLLEEVRQLLGSMPLLVSSGYRCPALNEKAGGAVHSAHMRGEAADFICPSYGSPFEVCQAIADTDIEFDQLILEFGQWTHIATGNRRMIFTSTVAGDRNGLHP